MGALNRSTRYERLSRPNGPRGASAEAFEQEAAPTEAVVVKPRQAHLAKGTPIAEVANSLEVSWVTLHRWRAEYGGWTVTRCVG